MAIVYRLTVLLALLFAHDSLQQDQQIHTSAPAPSQAGETDLEHDVTETSAVAPFEWSAGTGHALESRRRRPDKGWGAFAPALLAASTILPLLLTGLAALAGKALMSSVLALAVAGFNLFRSGQGAPAN